MAATREEITERLKGIREVCIQVEGLPLAVIVRRDEGNCILSAAHAEPVEMADLLVDCLHSLLRGGFAHSHQGGGEGNGH